MVVSFLFNYQNTTIIMKKITQRFDNALTSAVKFLVVGALSFGVLTPAFALTQISSQLDPGESNTDVTSLQQFLSAYPNWYPSAIVNGTFDAATRAAVIRFQAAYGLAQVGRVGPQTRDRINAIITGSGTVPSASSGQIMSQLDLGQTSQDVTNLQTYLANSTTFYPSGRVTGYFGGLTRAAVIRFQAAYGLAQVGRVGPQTRDKLNQLIGGIGPVVTSATGPAIYMPYLPVITNTTATFTWLTNNEAALGRVYYSTSPLQMNEGDINSVGFAVITGQSGSYDNVARSQQSSVLSSLQPNTSYYYTIVATDLGGNVSVIGPNNTFRTNP